MKRFKQIFNHQPPARLIALGFASTILLGTLLLLMPFSIRSGITVQPVDALFSATSAVCVTGLLTVDTADTFTPVGQAVMAVLIQIGGLGITATGWTLIPLFGIALIWNFFAVWYGRWFGTKIPIPSERARSICCGMVLIALGFWKLA